MCQYARTIGCDPASADFISVIISTVSSNVLIFQRSLASPAIVTTKSRCHDFRIARSAMDPSSDAFLSKSTA